MALEPLTPQQLLDQLSALTIAIDTALDDSPPSDSTETVAQVPEPEQDEITDVELNDLVQDMALSEPLSASHLASQTVRATAGGADWSRSSQQRESQEAGLLAAALGKRVVSPSLGTDPGTAGDWGVLGAAVGEAGPRHGAEDDEFMLKLFDEAVSQQLHMERLQQRVESLESLPGLSDFASTLSTRLGATAAVRVELGGAAIVPFRAALSAHAKAPSGYKSLVLIARTALRASRDAGGRGRRSRRTELPASNAGLEAMERVEGEGSKEVRGMPKGFPECLADWVRSARWWIEYSLPPLESSDRHRWTVTVGGLPFLGSSFGIPPATAILRAAMQGGGGGVDATSEARIAASLAEQRFAADGKARVHVAFAHAKSFPAISGSVGSKLEQHEIEAHRAKALSSWLQNAACLQVRLLVEGGETRTAAKVFGSWNESSGRPTRHDLDASSETVGPGEPIEVASGSIPLRQALLAAGSGLRSVLPLRSLSKHGVTGPVVAMVSLGVLLEGTHRPLLETSGESTELSLSSPLPTFIPAKDRKAHGETLARVRATAYATSTFPQLRPASEGPLPTSSTVGSGQHPDFPLALLTKLRAVQAGRVTESPSPPSSPLVVILRMPSVNRVSGRVALIADRTVEAARANALQGTPADLMVASPSPLYCAVTDAMVIATELRVSRLVGLTPLHDEGGAIPCVALPAEPSDRLSRHVCPSGAAGLALSLDLESISDLEHMRLVVEVWGWIAFRTEQDRVGTHKSLLGLVRVPLKGLLDASRGALASKWTPPRLVFESAAVPIVHPGGEADAVSGSVAVEVVVADTHSALCSVGQHAAAVTLARLTRKHILCKDASYPPHCLWCPRELVRSSVSLKLPALSPPERPSQAAAAIVVSPARGDEPRGEQESKSPERASPTRPAESEAPVESPAAADVEPPPSVVDSPAPAPEQDTDAEMPSSTSEAPAPPLDGVEPATIASVTMPSEPAIVKSLPSQIPMLRHQFHFFLASKCPRSLSGPASSGSSSSGSSEADFPMARDRGAFLVYTFPFPGNPNPLYPKPRRHVLWWSSTDARLNTSSLHTAVSQAVLPIGPLLPSRRGSMAFHLWRLSDRTAQAESVGFAQIQGSLLQDLVIAAAQHPSRQASAAVRLQLRLEAEAESDEDEPSISLVLSYRRLRGEDSDESSSTSSEIQLATQVSVNQSAPPFASVGLSGSPPHSPPSVVSGSVPPPKPSVTAGTSQSPKPSVTAGTSQSPKPSVTAGTSQSPKPSVTAGTSQSPKPSVTAGTSQSPKPSVTAGTSQSPKPSVIAAVTSPVPEQTAGVTGSVSESLEGERIVQGQTVSSLVGVQLSFGDGTVSDSVLHDLSLADPVPESPRHDDQSVERPSESRQDATLPETAQEPSLAQESSSVQEDSFRQRDVTPSVHLRVPLSAVSAPRRTVHLRVRAGVDLPAALFAAVQRAASSHSASSDPATVSLEFFVPSGRTGGASIGSVCIPSPTLLTIPSDPGFPQSERIRTKEQLSRFDWSLSASVSLTRALVSSLKLSADALAPPRVVLSATVTGPSCTEAVRVALGDAKVDLSNLLTQRGWSEWSCVIHVGEAQVELTGVACIAPTDTSPPSPPDLLNPPTLESSMEVELAAAQLEGGELRQVPRGIRTSAISFGGVTRRQALVSVSRAILNESAPWEQVTRSTLPPTTFVSARWPHPNRPLGTSRVTESSWKPVWGFESTVVLDPSSASWTELCKGEAELTVTLSVVGLSLTSPSSDSGGRLVARVPLERVHRWGLVEGWYLLYQPGGSTDDWFGRVFVSVRMPESSGEESFAGVATRSADEITSSPTEADASSETHDDESPSPVVGDAGILSAGMAKVNSLLSAVQATTASLSARWRASE
jgi:hypothetical protein